MFERLDQFITTALAVSLGAERAVEISKGLIGKIKPFETFSDSNRSAITYVLAFVYGTLIAFVAFSEPLTSAYGYGIVGCAGSGILHDLQGLLRTIKEKSSS